ncbi:unnamed protein product [Caenorhabditis auriculariae]|uniref:Transcription factor AP-2 C-terminal domain-containing protein n=1 Tax=Caenorhabditis auriculariae TaxID=2777116 RepID=A0A8S1HDT7_9PELO|nr:unnamed protein product [Caenorhabditis auriculariae]
MFGRRRACDEDFERERRRDVDEEDLQGEDESEGSRLSFGEGPVRTFAPSHMHISCHYDIPYHPHLIQPPQVCGVGTFTYTREFGAPPGFFAPAPPSIQVPADEVSLIVLIGKESRFQAYCSHIKSDELEGRNKSEGRSMLFVGGCASPQMEVVGEIYCTVPGRTSLLSSTTKYRVTVGEIQRRISPPECLNASLLGGILRKAKSKDGGKTLRDSLKKIEEAVHMAKDFALVCEKEFHAREIGIYLTKHGIIVDQDAVKRRAALEHSKKIIGELAELLSCDRTPLTPYIARQNSPLEPSIQQHLSHFTLVTIVFIFERENNQMTHGFGGVAMSGVLESIKSLIDESIKYIDRTCPQHMYIYNSR